MLILYNLYSLHCPLSGPDLIYISLLIIPCIIYHVANKETLTFTVINAFCVNLKHISKGNQLDLSQKVCNMSLEQTNGKIHIYIYILYVYVSNQIQQNKMQPEHVSGAVQYSALCVLRSAQSFTAKANAPLMFRSRSPVNRIPFRSRAHIKCLQ